ncbi:hypothetical protein D3C75_809900 [compost metagenome]
MVEELDALAFAAGSGFADRKDACPLVQEQAQIQCARVQHQPGMAVKMLVGEGANLLMHRVFVAADAFGFAHGFQRAEDLADLTLQARGIVAHAHPGQLGFADRHQPGDVPRVFPWVLFF